MAATNTTAQRMPARLPQTPENDDGDTDDASDENGAGTALAGSATPAQEEGPYFKRNSPERAALGGPGTGGTPMVVSGRVLTPDGKPVARALLDFWQADVRGAYDNAGYLLRGHQFTDEQGHYRLQTVVPGLYPGRTRHIHVKAQAPSGPILTTQLYFPNEPRNAADRIFDARLVLPIQPSGAGQSAVFNFVVTA